MRGRGLSAAAGGAVLFTSLWLPWFHRRLTGGFAPIRLERTLRGWDVLGGAGDVLAVLALASVVWGVARVYAREPSGLWPVIAGGLALLADVIATVDRVGADNGEVLTTVLPGLGLVLAFAGGLVIVLAGLATMVGEVRRRAQTG